MDIFSGDISPQAFKLVVRNEPGEVTLNKKMLRVIALVNEPIPSRKGEFFVYITDQLSMAAGPMAEVLIEGAVASLDYDRSSFPKYHLQDLNELLARKIFREEKRAIFKLNVFKKISSEEV